MNSRTRPLLGAAALAVGVAAHAQPGGELLSTRVAALLAAADDAANGSAKARRALPSLLDALARFGAHPAAGDDAVAEWRETAGLRGDSRGVWRGRVLGPAYHRGALAPAAAFRTEQLFLAGEQASVSVATSPKSPVRMTVSSSGASPCARLGNACAWLPIFTQRYTITVENQSKAPVRYYVVID